MINLFHLRHANLDFSFVCLFFYSFFISTEFKKLLTIRIFNVTKTILKKLRFNVSLDDPSQKNSKANCDILVVYGINAKTSEVGHVDVVAVPWTWKHANIALFSSQVIFSATVLFLILEHK